MANAIYDKARESFLKGEFNLPTDNIKLVMVDVAAYTVDLAAHQFLSDIAPAARIAISGNFASKTVVLQAKLIGTTNWFDVGTLNNISPTSNGVAELVLTAEQTAYLNIGKYDARLRITELDQSWPFTNETAEEVWIEMVVV